MEIKSPEENLKSIIKATHQYAHDQISKEKFRDIERNYNTVFSAATLELARKDIGNRITDAIKGFFTRHPEKLVTHKNASD